MTVIKFDKEASEINELIREGKIPEAKLKWADATKELKASEMVAFKNRIRELENERYGYQYAQRPGFPGYGLRRQTKGEDWDYFAGGYSTIEAAKKAVANDFKYVSDTSLPMTFQVIDVDQENKEVIPLYSVTRNPSNNGKRFSWTKLHQSM